MVKKLDTKKLDIKTITVSTSVKRSHDYQSAEVSMAMEVRVGDGETPEQVFGEAIAVMVPLVEAEADASLRESLRMKNGG